MYAGSVSCLWRAKVNLLAHRRFEIEQGTAHAAALDEEDDAWEEAGVEVVCCFISICRHIPLSNGSCLRAICCALHSSCHMWCALLPPNLAPPVPLPRTTTQQGRQQRRPRRMAAARPTIPFIGWKVSPIPRIGCISVVGGRHRRDQRGKGAINASSSSAGASAAPRRAPGRLAPTANVNPCSNN